MWPLTVAPGPQPRPAAPLCDRLGRRTRIGTFPGVHEILSYVSKLDIEVLGRSTQDIERLVRRDPLSFHENSKCLTYRLASAQGGIEVLRPTLFVFMRVGNRDGEAGQGHKDCCLGTVYDAKG